MKPTIYPENTGARHATTKNGMLHPGIFRAAVVIAGIFSPEHSWAGSLHQNWKEEWHVAFLRNYTVSRSNEQLEGGYLHPKISYFHRILDEWSMGFGFQFKTFYWRENHKDLPIFTVAHETLRHWYLGDGQRFSVGPKLLYLLPVQVADVPFRRNDVLPPEVGWAFELRYRIPMTATFGFEIYLNRWRGTKTTKIQGVESGVGIDMFM